MRGRKPKPTSQQIAAGDPRKKGVRKLEQKLASEPKTMRGLGECPKHLTGVAREAWNDWKEQLEIMQLDSKADKQTLEVLCVVYQQFLAAKRRGDAPKIAKFALAYRSLMSEFGLSPVARTRLTIEKEGSGDADLMKLLSQPRNSRQQTAVN